MTTLAGFVGRAVVIRYDPRDITEVRVFDHDDFVCRAVDHAHHGAVSLKEIQEARNARRRALSQGINERIAVVANHSAAPVPRPPRPRTSPASKLKV